MQLSPLTVLWTGDHRGPPSNHHMGPPDRPGPGGLEQGSGPYWGDSQQNQHGPQDYEGGQDFHGRSEEAWRPGPGYQGGGLGGHRGGGHRGVGGSGGTWIPEDRYSSADFRGRREDR